MSGPGGHGPGGPGFGRALQRRIEKHLLNPGMRLALRLGVAPRAFALLETTGRRSGRLRQTPVGGVLDGSTYWLVAEHGTGCAYVKNLVAHPEVRIKVGRTWRAGIASVLVDDDALVRRRLLDAANGVVGRADGVIFRRGATRPATVRIELC